MTRQKDDQKRESIHQAVVALSARVGLVGLSMSSIAREAGLATGTLYVYYPSKEALLRAVYWELKRAAASSYFERVDPAAPLKSRIRTIWMNALAHRRAHQAEAIFTEHYYQSGFIDEAGRRESVRLFSPFFELLAEGKRQQILKEVDPMLIAIFTIGPVIELASLESAGLVKVTAALQETAWQLTWDALKS